MQVCHAFIVFAVFRKCGAVGASFLAAPGTGRAAGAGGIVTGRLRLPWLYPSAVIIISSGSAVVGNNNGAESKDSSATLSTFEKILRYNIDRFAKILLNEQEESESALFLSYPSSGKNPLLMWLKSEYGAEKTGCLQIEKFSAMLPKDQLSSFKDFLVWFRQEFPYYRDKCVHCQAKGCVFQGNEPPTEEEQFFSPWIDTTEVSFCEKCHKHSRFPRYLAAMEITRRRRGRCSEYSLLMYRILRACGQKCRWIVDWANHVWVEVWMDNRWVHLDPCEASVDVPWLYQEWGKNQTFIIAFEAPLITTATSAEKENANNSLTITDVTQSYTSDTPEAIDKRRLADGATRDNIVTSLQRANRDMKNLTMSELVEQYQALQ